MVLEAAVEHIIVKFKFFMALCFQFVDLWVLISENNAAFFFRVKDYDPEH
jgi:hypothetical protein